MGIFNKIFKRKDYTFKCNDKNLFVKAKLIDGKVRFYLTWQEQEATEDDTLKLWMIFLYDITGRKDYIKELENDYGVDNPEVKQVRIIYNACKSDFSRIHTEAYTL